ncbi:EamA family transporter [Catenuloplanes indicus]|uniref:Drug/metabolite transporter (DMT)-like permease n=1 Tax=Catenuloplanes indicus TaxID=137267 RepID=A0AAE3VVU9_9ACTN|nr:DMT family transporter [Catenuloplanes indicus]MDQ0363925.1 drug/metabolite transporter (DMT)-like permease [Catenuloplanes indicus]
MDVTENPAARRSYASGLLAVVVATGLWGVGGTVAGSLFEAGVQPLELVAARTLITVAGLGVLLAVMRTPGPRARISWPLVIGFGLSVGLANALLFLAIAHLPVAVAMVLQNLAPAFVVAWLVLAGRCRPGVRIVAGLLLALAGVACVVELPSTPVGEVNLPGLLFGLGTAAAVAAFSVLGGRATRRYGAIRANVYAFAVSSVAWLLFFIPQGTPGLVRHGEQIGGILFVGVLGTLVPFVLFSWGTARVGAQAGAVNICLEPVFSAVLAWVWLGQALGALQLAGAVMVIAAVVHLQRQPVEERSAPERASLAEATV